MEIGAMLDELREMALKDEKIWAGTAGYPGRMHIRWLLFAVNAGNWDMKFMKWI